MSPIENLPLFARRWAPGNEPSDLQPPSRSGLLPFWLGAISSVAFVSVYAFRPRLIEFLSSTYDDALYIRLAMSIAQGEWLGKFDQMTLAKGPGYPLFLAAGSWLGLPVSIAQALLHCAAAGLFSWALGRIARSHWLGLLLFTMLVWNPWFTAPRIVREGIYTGLILLSLGASAYCLFVARAARTRIAGAVAAGAFLGWFWLTREEGVLLLPALAAMLLASLWWNRVHAGHWRRLLLAVAVAVASFLAVHAIFQTKNYLEYGSFTGVDFREKNFVGAINALQSVRTGEEKIFVPVSRAARQRIYEVSPAFASLKDYFDPPTGQPWQHGCDYWQWTCGEIASGWFVWALRGAVQANGHYQSPATSSNFFGRIKDEVNNACDSGRLACERSWIPYMPRVTSQQLGWIPREVERALALLISPPPPDQGGSAGDLSRPLRLLNHPVHMPSDVPLRHVLNGWYWPGSDDWFVLEVRSGSDERMPAVVERSGSADLVAAFKTEKAARQRFRIQTLCRPNCKLVFRGADGVEGTIGLGQLTNNIRAGNHVVPVGNGNLWFDSFDVEQSFDINESRIAASRHIRAWISKVYAASIPGLLMFGAFAFAVAAVLGLRGRHSVDVFAITAMAGTLWVFVVSRVGALVLIAITSFPAVDPLYMNSAIYIAPVAAVVSIWALVAAVRDRRRAQPI